MPVAGMAVRRIRIHGNWNIKSDSEQRLRLTEIFMARAALIRGYV